MVQLGWGMYFFDILNNEKFCSLKVKMNKYLLVLYSKLLSTDMSAKTDLSWRVTIVDTLTAAMALQWMFRHVSFMILKMLKNVRSDTFSFYKQCELVNILCYLKMTYHVYNFLQSLLTAHHPLFYKKHVWWYFPILKSHKL